MRALYRFQLLGALALTLSISGCNGDGDPPAECQPASCESQELECGVHDDGCGNVIDCGSCGDGYHCSGGTCLPIEECEPFTCETLGVECGTFDDGCEGSVDCGGCDDGYDCEQGVCVLEPCIPQTCASLGLECGEHGDGCEGTVDCGTCESGWDCEAGICIDNPCEPSPCETAPSAACSDDDAGIVTYATNGTCSVVDDEAVCFYQPSVESCPVSVACDGTSLVQSTGTCIMEGGSPTCAQTSVSCLEVPEATCNAAGTSIVTYLNGTCEVLGGVADCTSSSALHTCTAGSVCEGNQVVTTTGACTFENDEPVCERTYAPCGSSEYCDAGACLPLCGNGSIDEGELCDGTALGGVNCSDIDGFTGTGLACTADCQAYDTSACIAVPDSCGDGFCDVAGGENQENCAEDCSPGDGWICREAFYIDGDCDCGCGEWDPDCTDETSAACDYNLCPFDTEPSPVENWLCVPIATCAVTPIDDDFGYFVGPAVSTGITIGAGNDFTGSCGGHSAPDRAFTWTPPSDGCYAIDTAGSNFDTVLHIRSCSTGDELACNDDYDGLGTRSRINLAAETNETYVIIVDGFGSSSGSYVLNIALDPCACESCLDPPERECNAAGVGTGYLDYSAPGNCFVHEGEALCAYPSVETLCEFEHVCIDGVCVFTGCVDDDYEPNDSINEAVPLEPGVYEDLVVCESNEDFFAFELCAGGEIEIDVLFSHANGDIDAHLYNEAGWTLDWSTSTTNNEKVGYLNDTGADMVVYLQVFLYGGEGRNTYDIHATVNGCQVQSCGDHVVVSQVYGGGGNSGAQYSNDFVELHNMGASTASLDGWSIQYTSATGTTWGNSKLDLSGSIPAGGFYLIQLAAGATPSNPLPSPDAAGTINMAATNGKVALVSSTQNLSAETCPQDVTVVDMVSWGTGTPCEGMATPALSNTTAAIRLDDGCKDTDDNSADFVVDAPAPRNSSSPVALCNHDC